MTLIRSLWAGDVPLEQAFWWYAGLCGLLINLITSLLFLALLANDASVALLIAAFALPLPYNLLVVVGVWRSATRYEGPKLHADLARVGSLVWMAALTVA